MSFAECPWLTRTLALLRIRGASPRDLWRFVVATLLSPARGAPQSTAYITIVPASALAHRASAAEQPVFDNPLPPLQLGLRAQPAATPMRRLHPSAPATVPPAATNPAPTPESLRFDTNRDRANEQR